MKKKRLSIIGILLVGLIALHIYNNYLYEFHGLVIDADTKQPIENAVVVAVWYKEQIGIPGLGGNETRLVNEHEALTNSKGEWRIYGPKGYDIGSSVISNLLSFLTCFIFRPYVAVPPEVVIFKPGYCAWPAGERIGSCKSNLKAKEDIVELPKLAEIDWETRLSNVPRLPYFSRGPSLDVNVKLPLFKRYTVIEEQNNWYLMALPAPMEGQRSHTESFSERRCSSSHCVVRNFSYSMETPPVHDFSPLNVTNERGYANGIGIAAPLKVLHKQPQVTQRSVIDITAVIPLLPQTSVDGLVRDIASNVSDRVIQSVRKYVSRKEEDEFSFQITTSGHSLINRAPAEWHKFTLVTSTDQIIMTGTVYTAIKNNVGYIIIVYTDSSERQTILDKAVNGMVLNDLVSNQGTENKPQGNKPQRCY